MGLDRADVELGLPSERPDAHLDHAEALVTTPIDLPGDGVQHATAGAFEGPGLGVGCAAEGGELQNGHDGVPLHEDAVESACVNSAFYLNLQHRFRSALLQHPI